MNKKITITAGSILAAAMITATGVILPVFAQTSTGVGIGVGAAAGVSLPGGKRAEVTAGISASISAHIKLMQQRADQEIQRRITALNALTTRVNAMAKLSASEKSSLSSSIQAQITAMTDLQTKVDADATADSTSSLKTDIGSITASYRIFALILPQGAIEAASDRLLTIASTMNDLGTKFSARITAAQQAGNNVTASLSAMTDFNAKIADAQTNANAAASEVSTLMPDNGDKTVMASNTATLKGARTKLQAAQKDLVAARVDAQTIFKQLGSFKVSATATSTATTTVN